jgi:hypothetical protein
VIKEWRQKALEYHHKTYDQENRNKESGCSKESGVAKTVPKKAATAKKPDIKKPVTAKKL